MDMMQSKYVCNSHGQRILLKYSAEGHTGFTHAVHLVHDAVSALNLLPPDGIA